MKTHPRILEKRRRAKADAAKAVICTRCGYEDDSRSCRGIHRGEFPSALRDMLSQLSPGAITTPLLTAIVQRIEPRMPGNPETQELHALAERMLNRKNCHHPRAWSRVFDLTTPHVDTMTPEEREAWRQRRRR